MWQLFLDEFARRLVLQAVKGEGWKAFQELFRNDLSKPEAYADRIKREFGLRDYSQAQTLYDSNPAYWKNLYGSDPLNSRNHPASPPSSMVPRQPAHGSGYNYFDPAPMESGTFSPFGTRERSARELSAPSRPRYDTQFAAPSDDVSQDEADKRTVIRHLAHVPVAGEGEAAFDAGAPALPFVQQAWLPSPGPPATFNERFPSPLSPERALPNSTRPLGPFSGQPMRYLPPSVFGIPDSSGTPNRDLNDWLLGITRARPRQ